MNAEIILNRQTMVPNEGELMAADLAGVDLSIVIPVYNSGKILPELMLQISRALQGQSYEVILTNDGSADNSWDVMVKLSAEYPELKSICLAKNFGQDNAIMCGLHYTTGRYTVIMDDDLQHSPHDILKLRNKCAEGYDVCYADYSQGMRQAKWKNLGSILNAKQAEIFLEKPKGIYLSPFKIIHHTVVDSILQYRGPYPYVDGLIFRGTSSITQIKVEHHDRFDSNSNYTLKKSISVFFKHFTGFSIIPLRVSSLLGIILAVMGMLLSCIYVFLYFKGDAIEGWTTLVILQLVVGGGILMALGMIGEYLGRLYLLSSHSPQFVVRSIRATSRTRHD